MIFSFKTVCAIFCSVKSNFKSCFFIFKNPAVRIFFFASGLVMSSQSSIREMLLWFAEQVQQLRDLGAKDIIIDPGFGFGKTLDENYEVMNGLERLQVMGLPVLVGVSRKSMIYKKFGYTANEALNGTTSLNTIALMKGASILRVHDVREAVECCKIVNQIKRG